MWNVWFVGAQAVAFVMLVCAVVSPIEVVRSISWRHIAVAILLWPIVVPMAMIAAIERDDG